MKPSTAIAIEIRAAALAAESMVSRRMPLDGHAGIAMGWSIHYDWSRGLSVRYGDDDWLTTAHRRVGYLARQIICGDGEE